MVYLLRRSLAVNMFFMFHSEDIDNMFCSIKFINNAVIANPDGKLSLMITGGRVYIPLYLQQETRLIGNVGKEE